MVRCDSRGDCLSDSEVRIEVRLKEKIIQYEKTAYNELMALVAENSALKAFSHIKFKPVLMQLKGARWGPSKPIKLREQRTVPKYYNSFFHLFAIRDGVLLTKETTPRTRDILESFCIIVGADSRTVIWHDYKELFDLSLCTMINRINKYFPDE